MKVLIIQMKGAAINNTNTASFGNISAINDAGNYEFNYICGISGNDILLLNQLTRTYNTSGKVQLIPVPQYNIAPITDTVWSSPWNAATGTGGVVVLEADTIYLNSVITVSGQGFAGGALVNYPVPTYNCVWATNVTNYFLQLPPSPNLYYTGGPKGEGVAAFIANAEYGRGKQSNGGGGGNNHNTGGAGGANFGAGGNGGQRSNETFSSCHGTNPGIGGASLSSFGYSVANNRVFMGGGGGAGYQNNGVGMPGGNGGGIVIITANVINGNGGSIIADGVPGTNPATVDIYTAEGDGGGGGGAGGAIVLNANQVIGSITASATGARGSDASRGVPDCTGPGGGGGGGIVWTKGAAFVPNISAAVNAGSNGVISLLSGIAACRGSANGATPGSDGATRTDYVAPANTTSTCAFLSVTELNFFKGRVEEENILLWWSMNSIYKIASYEIERSVDQVAYKTFYRSPNNGRYSFSITDGTDLAGTIFYRLKITRTNGSVAYSPVIPITKNSNAVLQMLEPFPNPFSGEIKVSLLTKKNLNDKT